MRKDEQTTRKAIRHLNEQMIDYETFRKPTKIDNNKYWGWMRFRNPLPDWDAMEGGLVPIFNCYRPEAS